MSRATALLPPELLWMIDVDFPKLHLKNCEDFSHNFSSTHQFYRMLIQKTEQINLESFAPFNNVCILPNYPTNLATT